VTRTAPPAARRRTVELLPVVKAKLNWPSIAGPVLERPRLIRMLAENAARPVALIVADAGYGKTTLLGMFARQLVRPVVWYSLAPSDADPMVFGRYLLEGFRRDAPRFGRDFQRALEDARPGNRSVEMLAGTLANELATLKGPTRLLVLDNFQDAATNRPVLAFTDTLIRYLPAAVRLVVVSRSAPPLSLERSRSAGEVFELHSSHLRFTRDELGRLFAEVYGRPLSDAELSALEETTLGWPTAVHLVHEALRRDEAVSLEQVLADFRSSNLELHDYLSSEVYSRLAACCARAATAPRPRTNATTSCAASSARRSRRARVWTAGARSRPTPRWYSPSAASRSPRCGTCWPPGGRRMPHARSASWRPRC